MTYEARHAKGLNYGLAAAVLLLSILGFAVAGIIPTESGSNPLVGWAIVAACIGAAFIFFRRAKSSDVHIRIDERGVWTPRTGADPVAWSDIKGLYVMRAGIQRIARFKRNSGKDFGINTTFYDRGIKDLLAAVRHHRSDLVP